MALELQRRDVEPFNQPLMRPEELPSLPSRLRLIAKQLLQYQHRYRIERASVELASGIFAALGAV